jgi:hypothetical protein
MPTPPQAAGPGSVAVVSPAAYPLDEFYAEARLRLPAIELVDGESMPEPYKTLLVHRNDMTPTLEEFYGQKVRLQVLGRKHRGDLYFREVLLRLDESDRPVEFGAIKIFLALFPPAARRQILEERSPLGRILGEHEIAHTSRPKAFLRIKADGLIGGHFGLDAPCWLYGRRNTLRDAMQRSLAEIVEIVPPDIPEKRNE